MLVRYAIILLLFILEIGQPMVAQDAPPTAPAPAMTDLARPPQPNPADGITLIEPPAANNQGVASTGFPLKLPAGRLGMEPALSIDYNHENRHGWLGRGWDLTLPFITIETRWGVPRYDAENETETYLFAGSQLAPVAHRGPVRPREAERTFRPRIDGELAQITRHGDHPRNYWWEVRYPDGTTTYYGGVPEEGLMMSATLATPAGNLAHWAITRTVDVHGNRVDYHHERQADPGRPGTQSGSEIYLDAINYTGFGEEEGPYRVKFIRDRDLGEDQRPDVLIDLELGLKRVSADLLRRIEITFNGVSVRSYELAYYAGPFAQTLMKSLAEIDATGAEFYRHEFEYYDDVTQPGGNRVFFGDPESWSPGNDNVRGFLPLSNLPAGFSNRVSALGGATSTSNQVGMAVTFGPAGSPATKDFTVGGSVGSGRSGSRGRAALVDINGDYLPDKVFHDGNGIFYRPNLGAGQFGGVFAVRGVAEFSETKTTETSVGAEANIAPFFAGYENTTERTQTTTYFSDFNGDDLIDINYRGKIYFNHLGPDGHPTFTTNSGDTPSPIVAGAAPDPDLVTVDPNEQEALIDEAPLHDVVRTWTAPYTGRIAIRGAVRLTEFTDAEAQAYSRDDGVKVSIQGGGFPLWSATIPADDFAPRTPQGVSDLNVTAGTRIYFRVQSIFDGAYDRVQWDPMIHYLDRDTSLRDANLLPIYTRTSTKDFLMANRQEVDLKIDGEVTIDGLFTKPRTTDTLDVGVYLNGTAVMFHRFAPDSVVIDLPLSVADVPVDSGQMMTFRIISPSNVDWPKLNWRPRLFYSALADGSPAVNDDGSAVYSYCPAVDAAAFPHIVRPPQVWVSPDSGTFELRLSTGAASNLSFRQSRIGISVKGFDTLYASMDTLVSGIVTLNSRLRYTADTGDSLFVEIHAEEPGVARFLDNNLQVVRLNLTTAAVMNFTGAALYRGSSVDEMCFGNNYRGWGQFVYNGNRGRADIPIVESDLFVPEPDVDSSDLADIEIDPDNLDDPNAFGDIDDLGGDPTQDIFVVMILDPKAGNWRAYDDLTLVGPGYQSSSRFGVDDILLTPEFGSGGSAPAIISSSKIHAVAGGVGAGPVGLGVSRAWNDTRNTLDVMDMNNDRYPDIVSATRIQYTGVYGGLTGQSLSHSLGMHSVHSEATGLTAGGKFVDSGPSNSAHSSGKGSRRRFRRAKAVSKNSGAKAQSGNESAENSGSLGGNVGSDYDYAENSWFDVNGDGLTDKVWRGGDVALNYGYGFGPRESWGFSEIRAGSSFDYGFSAGVNISNNSIALGYGFTRTDNHSEYGMQDVNGDGRPDLLTYSSDSRELSVRLNYGARFGPSLVWGRLDEHYDAGDATAQAANTAVTVCINIIFVRICFNPSGSIGWGISRVLGQLDDINGDGFPDAVSSRTDDKLTVRPSTIGRTGLLRTVYNPLGGSFSLDYSPAEKSYEMPFPKWVLSEISIDDGLRGDGVDLQRSSIAYSDPRYDRHEREFYGFGEVRENQLDTENDDTVYRTYVSQYANDNYYEKGLLTAQITSDGADAMFHAKEWSYELRNHPVGQALSSLALGSDQGYAIPVMLIETDKYYEGDSTAAYVERSEFTYDSTLNVLEMKSIVLGDSIPRERKVYTYHDFPDKYLTSVMATEYLYDGDEWLRRTEYTPDERGNVLEIKRYLDEETYALFEMTYDEYGNQTGIVEPADVNGFRKRYDYEIDSVVHTYRTTMVDHYGFTSSQQFDYRFGQLISNTDIYDQMTAYTLDEKGRVTAIKYPLDPEYSFRFRFVLDDGLARVERLRYNPDTEEGVAAYFFADGLGRLVRSKYAANLNGNNALELAVKGDMHYDAFGRSVREYFPGREAFGNGMNYGNPVGSRPFTAVEFDILDRPVRLEMANGAIKTNRYSVGIDPLGRYGLRKEMTDGRGFVSQEIAEASGRLLAHSLPAASGDAWTLLEFNAAGEALLTTTENGTCASRNTYDRLGRMTEKDDCNAGKFIYTYDLTGQLLTKITPELRSLNSAEPLLIQYVYDSARLVRIDYPKNYQNRVELYYAGKDAEYNRGGRLWLRQDASGGEEYFYDINGNVTKSIRTLLINEASVRTWITEATYDNWGREVEMRYPDGEVLTYDYQADGKLSGLKGNHLGREWVYIDETHYDEFGDVIQRRLGNGTTEQVDYPDQSRRRSAWSTNGPGGALLSYRYRYDEEGNVQQMDQTAGDGKSVIPTSQQFDYDGVDQLTEASGQWSLERGEETFAYFSDYDRLFRPTERSLDRQSTAGDTLSARYDYRYDEARQHQAEKVSGRAFTFDENGNLLGYRGENGSYRYRTYRWDEEGRLTGISLNGRIGQFSYDAEGRLAISSAGALSGVFVDGAPAGLIDHGSEYECYVNPFFTATKTGFTKHYYAGETRIASKAGTGEFNNYYWYGRGLTAGDQNYTARIQDLANTVWNFYGELGIPPGPPTLPGYYAQPERTGEALPLSNNTGRSFTTPPPGWPGPVGPPGVDGPPGPPTWFAPQTPRDSLGAGYAYEGYAAFPESDITFYHADHLGNVHALTDLNGEVRHYSAWLPTGERAFQTGKKDSDYGWNGQLAVAGGALFYHGARFYDPEMAQWLSRDPLAAEFPGYNPYAFNQHNPLRFGDPDGRAPHDLFRTEAQAAADFGKIFNKKSIRDNYEYGALIYRQKVGGRTRYFYAQAGTDRNSSGFDPPRPNRNYGTVVADIHTHSRMEEGADGYNNFSPQDYRGIRADRRRGYLVNPRGELKLFDPKARNGRGKTTLVRTGLPYDRSYYQVDDPNVFEPRQRRLRRQLMNPNSTKAERREAVIDGLVPVDNLFGQDRRKRPKGMRWKG